MLYNTNASNVAVRFNWQTMNTKTFSDKERLDWLNGKGFLCGEAVCWEVYGNPSDCIRAAIDNEIKIDRLILPNKTKTMSERKETLTNILATIIQNGHTEKLTSYEVADRVEKAIAQWALRNYLFVK